jgi:hypothetical protein
LNVLFPATCASTLDLGALFEAVEPVILHLHPPRIAHVSRRCTRETFQKVFTWSPCTWFWPSAVLHFAATFQLILGKSILVALPSRAKAVSRGRESKAKCGLLGLLLWTQLLALIFATLSVDPCQGEYPWQC